jgi:hypothetical protein
MSLVGFQEPDDDCEKLDMTEAILLLLNVVLMALLCRGVMAVDESENEEKLGLFSYLTKKRQEQ